MQIEITDNRQEWLISLGGKFAAAVRAEREAEEVYRQAVARRSQLADRIAEVGGYIIDSRKDEVYGSAEG